ncbi:MAG: carbohydrate kinase [Planctomycetes bacterium]|nr:carbohydrate kinase [Planctomycetota bacterium]
MAVYLGFDSSTQSLTVIAIEVEGSRRRVLYTRSLNFDEMFPEYGTKNGVLPHDDPLVARSSPKLWAQALDTMMGTLAKESGIPLAKVRAISGSGQQHGSVFLDASAGEILAHIDPGTPLVAQVGGIFARETSPIWMDSSTREECEEITQAVGGEGDLALLTGSRAFERFTGPQIRKYYKEDPDGYERTDKIHVVSSFMATLLAGRHACIEPGDGAGMNLMDIARRRWSAVALQATAPDLETKLPELHESWTIVGPLAPYWVKRYGFPAKAKVVAWSGDNPCSLIGVGLVSQGRIAISLGTSSTLFGFMPAPNVDPTGSGHVFGSPTGDYMSLICFENGSLARERVRDEHKLDWEGFSQALRATPPGNRGGILLPWYRPEITPTVHKPEVRRYGLDERDGPGNVRAVVEAQMVSMAIHSAWMGVNVSCIHATGGAARNRDILKVMADVMNAEVYQFEVTNSACLGAALRAYHADHVADRKKVSWEDVTAGFAEPVKSSRIAPDPGNVAVYEELKKIYSACEAHALRGGDDPMPLIEELRKRR